MATHSSSSPQPPPPEQNPEHSSPSSPSPSHSPKPPKRSQPLPWTPQETVNLIQAYQEKWYSLKRGQLKSSQWEEVAVTVAARCGLDDPSKTVTQCRHKIEKLRKRYRTEKLKPNPRASWEYFDHMDRLERGPPPISVVPFPNQDDDDDDDDIGNDNEDVDDEDDNDNEALYDDAIASRRNKSKSINRIIRGHLTMNKPAKDRKLRQVSDAISSRFLQNPVLGKRKERYETEDEDDEEEEEEEYEEEEEGGGREMVSQLAAEIKAFAGRFVKIENKKIEMMRETERCRLEMENKRMQMIIDSQRKIVDSIARAFASHKKINMSQDI